VNRCRVSATYIYNIAWKEMSFKRTGISFYEKCRNNVKSPLETNRPVHFSSIRGNHTFSENQWSKLNATECWRLLEEHTGLNVKESDIASCLNCIASQT